MGSLLITVFFLLPSLVPQGNPRGAANVQEALRSINAENKRAADRARREADEKARLQAQFERDFDQYILSTTAILQSVDASTKDRARYLKSIQQTSVRMALYLHPKQKPEAADKNSSLALLQKEILDIAPKLAQVRKSQREGIVNLEDSVGLSKALMEIAVQARMLNH
jgi:hypothetical protein